MTIPKPPGPHDIPIPDLPPEDFDRIMGEALRKPAAPPKSPAEDNRASGRPARRKASAGA